MDQYKRCPFCGEKILAEAKKCKYCREWLLGQSGGLSGNKEASISHSEQPFTDSPQQIVVYTELSQFYQNSVEDVYYKTRENSKNNYFPKRVLLDEFYIKNGILTVSTKKGSFLSAPIKDVEVGYTDTHFGKVFTLKYGDRKVNILVVSGMLSDEEWENINNIMASFPNYGLSTLEAISDVLLIVGIIVFIFLAISVAIINR